MFDSLPSKESRPLALLRRATLALLSVCFVTALASGHRAYFQVRDLRPCASRQWRFGATLEPPGLGLVQLLSTPARKG
jgi:hypothetical protein